MRIFLIKNHRFFKILEGFIVLSLFKLYETQVCQRVSFVFFFFTGEVVEFAYYVINSLSEVLICHFSFPEKKLDDSNLIEDLRKEHCILRVYHDQDIIGLLKTIESFICLLDNKVSLSQFIVIFGRIFTLVKVFLIELIASTNIGLDCFVI
jgi:hypothetical protein